MSSKNLITFNCRSVGLSLRSRMRQLLVERLEQGPIALYCGFDPTADSPALGIWFLCCV